MEQGLSYARASQDRTGQELSVSRQHEDQRKLARQRGVRIIEVTDNDVSAAGRRKRPGFEQALDMVRRGEVSVIIATDMSRLTRGKALDEARLLELGVETGLKLWFVRAPDLDLSTAAGRLTASILIAAARHEIEQKSERQLRGALQAAQQGRRIGGRRPFGYEQDGMTIREPEAQAVRDAYTAVLAGVPVGRIAADWNKRSLARTQGGYAHGCDGTCAPQVRPTRCPQRLTGQPSPWDAQSVGPLLLNPRYAGLRSHVTEQMLKTMNPRQARLVGIVGEAQWEGLVSEDVFRAAAELLTDPERRKTARSGRQLLTGTALCGICRATVHAGGAAKQASGENYAMYRCSGSTGHVGRAAGPVDWWVGELVIARMSRPDAAKLLTPDRSADAAKLRQEARALRTRRDSLATLLADGVLTEAGVRRESAKLAAKLAEIEQHLTASGKSSALAPLVAAKNVRAAWEALDTDRRRAAIDALWTVVLLSPGRGTRFGRSVEQWEAQAERIKATVRLGPPA